MKSSYYILHIRISNNHYSTKHLLLCLPLSIICDSSKVNVLLGSSLVAVAVGRLSSSLSSSVPTLPFWRFNCIIIAMNIITRVVHAIQGGPCFTDALNEIAPIVGDCWWKKSHRQIYFLMQLPGNTRRRPRPSRNEYDANILLA